MVRLPENEGKRPAGSTGLGLYICRQIAQAHGGVISVESSDKEGTTFTVILPRHFTPQDHPET
jgi:signal transduction histidine kinase